MTITYNTLTAVIQKLTAEQRQILTEAMRGKPSAESRALIRQLRRCLKRRVRSRLPRKLLWLA